MASQSASPAEAEVARLKLASLVDDPEPEMDDEAELDARLASLRTMVGNWYPGMRVGTALTSDEALDLFGGPDR